MDEQLEQEMRSIRAIQILIETITEGILKEIEPVLWKLARTTRIPGYESEDLMQEMRAKVWQIIKENYYDPDLCKETTYFYRVCKRLLIDLNKARIYKYNSTLPENREYRDDLDQKSVEVIEDIDDFGVYPSEFVQNFSESFKNSYF